MATAAPTSRAPRIPEDIWGKHRSDIERLYRDLELQGVIQLMESNHGFHATDKQYKRQLAKWGFRKNFTSKELDAVLSNPGGDGIVRGIPVPKARVERYARRRRLKKSFALGDQPFSRQTSTIPTSTQTPEENSSHNLQIYAKLPKSNLLRENPTQNVECLSPGIIGRFFTLKFFEETNMPWLSPADDLVVSLDDSPPRNGYLTDFAKKESFTRTRILFAWQYRPHVESCIAFLWPSGTDNEKSTIP
ncbi:uncharacterized protein PV07_10767 [Cladophialophora immunda]|uniref:Clr5 domain-containing protein n=1 Tax=Cladophialophora immunda TaxID=569365 RepID=A0A0D2AJP1_9EURO|nr:uncharacterized protein PV07_10767 [Cladophialophora immunda]KIW25102.1 hypothetical protein PV07_10767 [Cladophialophora immunda]